MKTTARVVAFLCFAMVILPAARAAESGSPMAFLPTRAIAVEGGSIAFQAGVRCERDLKRFHMLFRRHPLQYFLAVTNESKAPVWVTAELQLPDEQPEKVEGTLGPGKNGIIFWRANGLVGGKPVPIRIQIHADAGRARLLDARETSVAFSLADAEKFQDLINDVMTKAQFSNERQCPVASGWREMKSFDASTPGTAADAQLERDIKLLLWKEQSIANWNCQHEVVKAAQLAGPSETFVAGWPDELQKRIETIRAEGGASFERWSVTSCDVPADYEVMMMKSSRGGTNVMAKKIPSAPPK